MAEKAFLVSMYTAVCSEGLNGIWLTLIWCRGATMAKLSGPDMMGWDGSTGVLCVTVTPGHCSVRDNGDSKLDIIDRCAQVLSDKK
jgi:hypothetical protein